MKARKIENADVKDLLIASLPTRPTAPRSLGGMGYKASQMKSAFDKLPLYIIERYNELISDILALGDDSLAAAIPTGIKEGQSLSDLFADIESGAIAGYLTFLGKSLGDHITHIYGEMEMLKKALNSLTDKGECK